MWTESQVERTKKGEGRNQLSTSMPARLLLGCGVFTADLVGGEDAAVGELAPPPCLSACPIATAVWLKSLTFAQLPQ